MHNSKLLLAMLAGTTGLAACSGSDGGATASRTAVFADQAGRATQALADGATLTADRRSAAGIQRNYNAQTAEAAADPTARVSRNAAGGLDLTVAGRTISFTPADTSPDGFGYETADGSASIWAWSADSMAEQLDPAGPGFTRIFDYYTDLPGNTGQNGFIVTGTETRPSALATLPTATYNGWSRIRVAPTEGFANWNDSVREARGDITLTANFGAGTVAGGVTNMDARAPRSVDPTRTWTPFAGSLTLGAAPISGNSFEGAVTADAGFTATIGTVADGSTYSGRFYGGQAQEAAGVFNITGTGSVGGGMVGWGVFQAER
ncbi:MAG: transferrin-binding protein-like solute binding protein [Rhodobacteraceae bacterium]|jgi:hypothetical protein|nr:transferrin-binding protein-like solute binding protein [Paracoccaceae bacterium]